MLPSLLTIGAQQGGASVGLPFGLPLGVDGEAPSGGLSGPLPFLWGATDEQVVGQDELQVVEQFDGGPEERIAKLIIDAYRQFDKDQLASLLQTELLLQDAQADSFPDIKVALSKALPGFTPINTLQSLDEMQLFIQALLNRGTSKRFLKLLLVLMLYE